MQRLAEAELEERETQTYRNWKVESLFLHFPSCSHNEGSGELQNTIETGSLYFCILRSQRIAEISNVKQ